MRPAKDIVLASRPPWTMVPWSNRSCASFRSDSTLTDSAWTTAHEDQEASRVLGCDDNSVPSTRAALDVVTEPEPASEILAVWGRMFVRRCRSRELEADGAHRDPVLILSNEPAPPAVMVNV